MAEITGFVAGDRFKVVIPNPKSIPVGTTAVYKGENQRCCGGTYKMWMIRDDTGEEFCAFDHWLEKIS